MKQVLRAIVLILLMTASVDAYCQKTIALKLKKNEILFLADSVIAPKNDTTVYIPRNMEYQIYDNKYVLSDTFYDSVYKAASKRRVTKELYRLLINEQARKSAQTETEPVESEDFFEDYKGKTIGAIQFRSVPIIEGSIYDTTQQAVSTIGKTSNKLHKKTRRDVIMKHLLFDLGDELDPYELSDSERIIRSLAYIEDARIVVKPINGNDDEVTVVIISKDRFPWSFDMTIDENDAYIFGFTNQNVVGSGNEFRTAFFYHSTQLPSSGYDFSYTQRNIKETFIDGTASIANNYLGKDYQLSFKRDFLTPQIRYFGEASVEYAEPIEDLLFADSIYVQDFRSSRIAYDLWGARAFMVGERQNVAFALRLEHDNYAERPMVAIDSNELYQDHHFLLSALSYSKIKFLKSKNIVAFNITEDIPVGFLFSILYGKDWNEFSDRTYRGIKAAYSSYFDYGYLFLNYEKGAYRRDDRRINEVTQVKIRHFTPLFNVRRAKARLYTRFFYYNGNDLSIPLAETLRGPNRIKNIDGLQIQGNKLYTFDSEYVVFQPWYFYGFRFATYGHLTMGRVKETRIENPFNRFYYNGGAGIRIRNESLVFNTFEFRFSLYPDPPTQGQQFFFKISLSPPSFFANTTLSKPTAVGFN